MPTAGRSESWQAARERADSLLQSWDGDAVLEVEGQDVKAADALAQEAAAIIRLFMRPSVPVNVDLHKIGLVGDVNQAVRDYVVLEEASGVAAVGWRRVDGVVPFRFSDELLDGWDADGRLRYLGSELERAADRRGPLFDKALTAILLLDTAFRSLEPTVRVLAAVVAIEALLSANDLDDYKPQALQVARRVAYLNCQAKCGRDRPCCPYLQSVKSEKTLMAALQPYLKGEGWACSSFLEVTEPRDLRGALPRGALFTIRNEVAHTGRTTLTEKEIRAVRYLVDRIVLSALNWFASRPFGSIADLDAEIEQACRP